MSKAYYEAQLKKALANKEAEKPKKLAQLAELKRQAVDY